MTFANPFVEDGIARLRTRWPQAHFEPCSSGSNLIIIPGVILPEGYDKTICTLLFVVPPGFPGTVPADFFTDIDIHLANRALPHHTVRWGKTLNAQEGCGNFPKNQWPQWERCMWWKMRLQDWRPNRDTLYTYAQTARQRLAYVH
jgi:Prokaryotic E2 family E